MRIFDKFFKKGNEISLSQLINTQYEQKYFDACKFIWKNYVPQNGQSNILQGELLRELEKLRCEAQDNGNINWDETFDFFCDFLKEILCTQTIYSDIEKESYRLILSHFKECGNYAVQFHKGIIAENDLVVSKLAYVNDNLYDIIADAIGKLHVYFQKPIPFEPNIEIKR